MNIEGIMEVGLEGLLVAHQSQAKLSVHWP